VCVIADTPVPGREAHAFAGPRSLWGARLARAVHRAVRDAVTEGAQGGPRASGVTHGTPVAGY
ncbi:adenosylcobinamide amidohydrolase, partial [Actinospica acidiphila]